jgi:hypothetical protein
LCWDGAKGKTALVQGRLPFAVNRLTVKTTITRTWEAWACGEIGEFDESDAGIIDGVGGRGRKKKLSDDEIQVALPAKHARVGAWTLRWLR